jgi:hypothetical protein
VKRAEREFVVTINQKAHLGVSPESQISIELIGRTGQKTVAYSASVEKVHAALARIHAKEHPNPSGKRRRRRLFTSSEELRKYRQEHPEEFES